MFVKVDGRYRLEHRIVAEQMLGRPLADSEVVHHINGNPLDNTPENLVVCGSTAEHWMHHVKDRRARKAAQPLVSIGPSPEYATDIACEEV
jgi:hypothetical protein